MSWPAALSPEEERLRPLYARVLRLRHVDPSGMLCFIFFEGTVMLGLLLGLAELVSWWGVLILPASVAVMVKVNDVVAAAVVRSAARVPAIEQERFRREMRPVVGRAAVPDRSLVGPGPAVRPADPASGGHAPAKPLSSGRRSSGRAPAGLLPTGLIPVGSRTDVTAVVQARLELTAPPQPPVDAPKRSGPGPGPGTAVGPPGAAGQPAGSAKRRYE